MSIFEQIIFVYGFLIRTVAMATESPPQGLNNEIKNVFVLEFLTSNRSRVVQIPPKLFCTIIVGPMVI